MYTTGKKGILGIDILVNLVLLTEAEFSCALCDFGKTTDTPYHHDKQH